MVEYYPPTSFTDNNPTCIALGNFDGVHIGHKKIINQMVSFAKSNNLTSCIYTFETHPALILHDSTKSAFDGKLLTTNEEKSNILESLGVEAVYFESFVNVCKMESEEFCELILIKQMKAKAVFCGENFRFGKGGRGDASFLKSYLKRFGVEVFIVPYAMYDGKIVSSTLIRETLARGETEVAAKLLSRSFSIYAEVIHGKQLGHKLGFPTLNQAYPENKLILPFGVYASICEIDSKLYLGVSNVGIKPTVTDKNELLCETHVIGYDNDAYGKKIKVNFYKKLRDEKKFSSLDELKQAVLTNIDETKLYFSTHGSLNDDFKF